MKSVLISIQPKWCDLISKGKKTIEVKKTKPKLETPFKVYIYCTVKDYNNVFCVDKFMHKVFLDEKAKRKVIGEFFCDEIFPISIYYSDVGSRLALKEFPYTCLTDKQIIDYLGNGNKGYGWHISNLLIYDEPKSITDFSRKKMVNSYTTEWNIEGIVHYPKKEIVFEEIKTPPQSWCYVE